MGDAMLHSILVMHGDREFKIDIPVAWKAFVCTPLSLVILSPGDWPLPSRFPIHGENGTIYMISIPHAMKIVASLSFDEEENFVIAMPHFHARLQTNIWSFIPYDAFIDGKTDVVGCNNKNNQEVVGSITVASLPQGLVNSVASDLDSISNLLS